MMQVEKAKHEKLKELIGKIEIAMLTTEDGKQLRSRPMSTSKLDEDGNLWFFTNEFSSKVDEIQADRQVNLSYAEKGSNTYVSVSGKASLVHDKQKIDELWSPILKAWFPDGKEDPSIALLKVVPEHAEYWDGSDSKMVQLFKIGMAAISGDGYESSGKDEHGKVNL